jgi:hypothetical protein
MPSGPVLAVQVPSKTFGIEKENVGLEVYQGKYGIFGQPHRFAALYRRLVSLRIGDILFPIEKFGTVYGGELHRGLLPLRAAVETRSTMYLQKSENVVWKGCKRIPYLRLGRAPSTGAFSLGGGFGR